LTEYLEYFTMYSPESCTYFLLHQRLQHARVKTGYNNKFIEKVLTYQIKRDID